MRRCGGTMTETFRPMPSVKSRPLLTEVPGERCVQLARTHRTIARRKSRLRLVDKRERIKNTKASDAADERAFEARKIAGKLYASKFRANTCKECAKSLI